jgi:ATP-binding cassette subfamily B multidrug efflux pump
VTGGSASRGTAGRSPPQLAARSLRPQPARPRIADRGPRVDSYTQKVAPAFRRLLPFLLVYRRQFITGLLCVIVTTTIQLLSPWVLKYAVDDLNAGVTRSKLAFYAATLLGIAAIGGVFRYLMRQILIGASRDIEFDVRNAFFARLQLMPVGYYQARRTGDLMSRATNDLNAVRMMIGPAVMYSANTILVFIVAILLMVSLDARLTLMALVPLPFVTIVVRYFGSAIHKRFEAIQEQLAQLSAVVQEALAGVRVVRAYNQQAHEIERFSEANREYVRRNRVLIRLQGLFFPSMTLFLGFGSLLVLWIGSQHVIRGEITLGEFVAFNAYLVMLSWPMIAFGWVTNILQRGMASWKRMLEVLDAIPDIDDRHASEAGHIAPLTGAIEIRDLVFTYPGTGRPVLDHVSLTIAAGQTVALVGATGSGKSTLIHLIPRLHDPPPGTVLLDGVDVREIPLDRLRGAIGFVPQEPFLFSNTIAENVSLGLGGDNAAPGSDRLQNAAAIARLDKDVASFPKGYETLVGERGITLSGGQKQRTAIARAVMLNPRILILDDALSAVDTYTEEEILERLRVFMRKRTSIIVSHRVSTVRHADLIVVLQDGRIAEQGTHDELVQLGGLYADLHQKQLLQEELAAS